MQKWRSYIANVPELRLFFDDLMQKRCYSISGRTGVTSRLH